MATTLSRRRTSDETSDRPSRGRSRSLDDKGAGVDEDRPSRGSRRSERDDDGADEQPRNKGKATGGFGSYSSKRKSNGGGGNFASEFKPGDYKESVLIKILDDEPFDVYQQHWVEDGAARGKTRHSFVCRDDEYFDDEDGCPVCDAGVNSSTYALFNILNLDNPRKPVVEVWKASVTVADKLERASNDSKTSPLNRNDLYWEITVTKTKNKTSYDIVPVKARDLEEDFDFEPFPDDELESFEDARFDDRTAVQMVDSYEDLAELAESLD